MNIEDRFKDIQIALRLADWFSSEDHVNYDTDFSSGFLFVEGKIVFIDNTVLEFSESVTPERTRYRYQYMKADGELIFRYDNVPHHPEISTYPHHKHYPDRIIESHFDGMKQVIEEVIDYIIGLNNNQ